MRSPSAGPRPLCRRPASITDWRPTFAWLTVEDCGCGGYFVDAAVIARLPGLVAQEREELALRVRAVRAMDREAWRTTRDGTFTGSWPSRSRSQTIRLAPPGRLRVGDPAQRVPTKLVTGAAEMEELAVLIEHERARPEGLGAGGTGRIGRGAHRDTCCAARSNSRRENISSGA
jgi:hypothetical protein